VTQILEAVSVGGDPVRLIGSRAIGARQNKEHDMPQYAALIYSRDVDWSSPDEGQSMQQYGEFGEANGSYLRGGAALHPTSTATTVRVTGGRGGEVVTSDGPYAETKEVLGGFYLLECADLDEAISVASQIPAAWDGAVEVRPVLPMG
jgi:hypothetical protein